MRFSSSCRHWQKLLLRLSPFPPLRTSSGFFVQCLLIACSIPFLFFFSNSFLLNIQIYLFGDAKCHFQQNLRKITGYFLVTSHSSLMLIYKPFSAPEILFPQNNPVSRFIHPSFLFLLPTSPSIVLAVHPPFPKKSPFFLFCQLFTISIMFFFPCNNAYRLYSSLFPFGLNQYPFSYHIIFIHSPKTSINPVLFFYWKESLNEGCAQIS